MHTDLVMVALRSASNGIVAGLLEDVVGGEMRDRGVERD